MAWVPMVAEDDAEGVLVDVYERARARFTFVPDAVRIFSIRPEVAEAQDRYAPCCWVTRRALALVDPTSSGRRCRE